MKERKSTSQWNLPLCMEIGNDFGKWVNKWEKCPRNERGFAIHPFLLIG
ncbi:hypothetical protein SLEP1_g57989 [Rubroshorea leprosula]|uniref:Uncharacterized protein n=1 Tax=Rubroshorea leprosula TaxID=152421 RepID=A0AAV5MMT4_9ROSI|nr:hypothetical protein SLEP1_g57989 [Rubroshorea leprosula]